jgi:uncharacterized membrane protein
MWFQIKNMSEGHKRSSSHPRYPTRFLTHAAMEVRSSTAHLSTTTHGRTPPPGYTTPTWSHLCLCSCLCYTIWNGLIIVMIETGGTSSLQRNMAGITYKQRCKFWDVVLWCTCNTIWFNNQNKSSLFLIIYHLWVLPKRNRRNRRSWADIQLSTHLYESMIC